jgi:hypothetical protein
MAYTEHVRRDWMAQRKGVLEVLAEGILVDLCVL